MVSRSHAASSSTLNAGNEVARLLRGLIDRDGPITFAAFMRAALYHPVHGYYMRDGEPYVDYFTSVSVHPGLFGATLVRHLDDVWTALGEPTPFQIVELGSGDGRLAGQIAQAAPSRAWGAILRYRGVELSAARRRVAAAREPGAEFVPSMRELEPCAAAAIISNELFDALPVRLARRDGRAWVEQLVDADGEEFRIAERPAGERIRTYAQRYASAVPDGGRLEVREDVDEIYAQVSRLAPRSILTTIDYGGTATELHGPRLRAGTLLAYRRQQASEDALGHPGDTDLTAHVNFSELADAGRRHGFRAGPLGNQADFLSALGIGEYLVKLQRDPGVTDTRYAAAREAVFQLVSPTDLGRFRVLVQARGADMQHMRGLPGI